MVESAGIAELTPHGHLCELHGLKDLVSPWGHLAPEQDTAVPKTESDS